VIRRHTLAAADNRRLAHLCGPLDANLRAIEAALDVRLGRRDATFRIEGGRGAIERTQALIDALYARADAPIDEAALQLAIVEHRTRPPGHEDGRVSPRDGESGPLVLRTRHADLTGRTPNQERYLRQMLDHDLTFGIGPAGTGKTFLAVAMAVDALNEARVQRLILVRPAVEAGEKLGFLPGDLSQKVDPYLRPLYDALYEMLGVEKVAKLLEKNVIEIAPLAYMRGRTLNDAFVILDEAQNTTVEQMKMFLTRIGFGSTAVVTGDMSQTDLPKHIRSGLSDALEVLRGVDGISFSFFGARDVVRHPLVARIVRAYDARDGQAADAEPA